ncbi:MAG TPA: glycosyltransferase [Candidatus Eisenbacteria bacterium]|nr:glycosyltransferase [Candidatus Eisenbacteria bacterium]
MTREAVTVIATVWNEAAAIHALLDSLLGGSRIPDEIVIADGGSTDDTYGRLQDRASADPRIRAILAPGNRSVGRNAAVRAARHAVIACTDAGVEVDPEWLEWLVRPFEVDPGVDVVAGFYRPVGTTPFERAAGVVSAPSLSEVDPARFLPSTRSVAFRRAAFDLVGGFDESLSHNEDTPFALALKREGRKFAFAPEAIVRWHPRGNLRAFMHQHRRFGTGDGESRVQGWFYGTIAAKYGAGLALFAAGFWFKPAWLVLAFAVGFFAIAQARRGSGRIPSREALLIPPLKIAYDLAYLWGYTRGRLGPRRGSR